MISGPLIAPTEAVELVGRAVFLDARAGSGAAEAYTDGRVRGAHRVDLERDLSEIGDPEHGGRHPLPSLEDWRTRVGRWGISEETPVLVYDDAGGGMAAARLWWMLDAIGHRQLAVVDGGLRGLRSAGAPVDSGEPPVTSGEPYPRLVDAWPTVDADFVERVRRDPTWRVLDARAPDRFEGRNEPLDPIAGHIPGARNLYWGAQVDDTGAFRPEDSLRERYERALSGVPPDRVVCYCGSGVTACHLLLTMRACGLDGARLYVGSWSEWCRQGRDRTPA